MAIYFMIILIECDFSVPIYQFHTIHFAIIIIYAAQCAPIPPAHGPSRGVAETRWVFRGAGDDVAKYEDGDIRREIYTYHSHTDTRSSLNAIERARVYTHIIIYVHGRLCCVCPGTEEEFTV